jgi:hypothetical protein
MLDFLYADHERVASFLAQKNGLGALVGNEETAAKSTSSEKEAGLNLAAARGSAKGGTNWSKDVRLAYDPLWMNSAKLVDMVIDETRDRNVEKLDYGKLLTISGQLLCMDQAIFSNLLKSPSIVDQIAGGMKDGDSVRSSKAQAKERKDIAETIREFINTLPLGVVFTLFDGENAYWFNVKREYLQLQALDIPLKFPVQIGGEWHVTGVIDALPQDYAQFSENIGNYGEKLVFSQAISIITPIVTPLVGLFGRPADAYGLSPVTIHREITL